MKTIQPNENITLEELQERVKYILSFKPRLEKLMNTDIVQGVEMARILRQCRG